MALPPGQQRIDTFPRFGTHFGRPAPTVAPDHTLRVTGAVAAPIELSRGELDALPRTEIVADFHCVAGWSATDLRWEGVAFADFYALVVEPRLEQGAVPTHFVFTGLDGFEALVEAEDALAPNVLLAQSLGAAPLTADHGAPLRLVSPDQYGYMNVKHLAAIEVHTTRPRRPLGAATRLAAIGLKGPFVMRHPRARVWAEERHPYLPTTVARALYRLTIRGLLRRRGAP